MCFVVERSEHAGALGTPEANVANHDGVVTGAQDLLPAAGAFGRSVKVRPDLQTLTCLPVAYHLPGGVS